MDMVESSSPLFDQLRIASSKGQLDEVVECVQAGASFEPDQVSTNQ